MTKFLTSNETRYRLLRTILQGIIGVIIANLDFIFSSMNVSPGLKTLIVALVMAILSPIMSELGTSVSRGTEIQNTFNAESISEMMDYEGKDDENENDTAEE